MQSFEPIESYNFCRTDFTEVTLCGPEFQVREYASYAKCHESPSTVYLTIFIEFQT